MIPDHVGKGSSSKTDQLSYTEKSDLEFVNQIFLAKTILIVYCIPTARSLVTASRRVCCPRGFSFRKLQMMKLTMKIRVCSTANRKVQMMLM